MSSPQVSETANPKALFLSSLPTIDRIVAVIGRRYALPDAEVEEFGSWAKTKVIESGYGVFQKFGGRSSLPTYLTVVLTNLFKDYRNSRWGRWRPSAVAKRLGTLAIRFETLVYRDGHPAREAMTVLEAAGASADELKKIASQVPARTRPKEVSLDAASEATDGHRADLSLWAAERDGVASRTFQSIESLLSTLSAEDQVIIRMRFWDEVAIADIARALGIEQKPLYRRLESIQSALRKGLLGLGIDQEQIREALNPESGN